MLAQLGSKADCEQRLKLLCAPQVVAEEQDPVRKTRPAGVGGVVREVAVSDFQPVKVLTWNIAGDSKSASAPESFSFEDKWAAVQQEIVVRCSLAT